jgi:hypothetical protein
MDALGKRIERDRAEAAQKRREADEKEKEAVKLRRDADEIDRLCELARSA